MQRRAVVRTDGRETMQFDELVPPCLAHESGGVPNLPITKSVEETGETWRVSAERCRIT
jgi:hypothetical protein